MKGAVLAKGSCLDFTVVWERDDQMSGPSGGLGDVSG